MHHFGTGACIFVPDLILEGADARQSEAINIYCMATIMSSVKVYFSKFGISTSSLPKKQALYVPAAKSLTQIRSVRVRLKCILKSHNQEELHGHD